MTRTAATRRAVLSALGVAATSSVTGIAAATTSQQALEPTHTVGTPGAREAVVAGDGVHAFDAVGDFATPQISGFLGHTSA
jgi:hypothetical protein